jgi:hypothetical protein
MMFTVHAAAQPNAASRGVDCGALKKQSDGTWLVVRATTIVDTYNNSWAFDAGQTIGPASIVVTPAIALTAFFDKACGQ